eukprot:TRINITY_DN1477_c0_g1_i1.p1 TRINITY_DN1477_c0_g1~~TRINITY_DN1477_c0_g1_i1.p1  ORF type:complete len:499 (+),score=105.11 TRINITY_DN1477_c0_g1_i1:56-1552(+)
MDVTRTMLAVFLALFCIGATFVDGAPPAPGSALRALRLDETSYIQFSNISQGLSGNMTFEAWIRCDVPDNGLYNTIVSRYRTPTEVSPEIPEVPYTNMRSDFNFQIQRDGNLNFFMGAVIPGQDYHLYGALLNGGTIIQPNTWTHVACSFRTPVGATEPDLISIYVNGVEVATSGWLGGERQDLSMDHPIEVGRYINPEYQFWQGDIDEIRFWNVYRTASEIAATMNTALSGLETGLFYYKLNQAGGSDIPTEPVSTVNDGTLTGGVQVNSGVQGLESPPLTVTQGVAAVVPLEAVSPNSAVLLECECTRKIHSLPANGTLYTDHTGTLVELQVGDVLPVGVTSVLYMGTATVPQNGQIDDAFLYSATDANTGEESTPIYRRLVVMFDTYCSGGEFDNCLVCNGDNSTCDCSTDPTHYRGVPLAELDKAILLYEIDRSILAFNELSNDISSRLVALDNTPHHALDLAAVIQNIRNWDATGLQQFLAMELELQNVLDLD